jgi:di-heme oxidoreductase (putative peroxidase)
MNFYGDSYHVTRPGYSYTWSYGPANANRMVVNTPRVNSELGKTYQPLQVNLGAFQTPDQCQLVPLPPGVPVAVWPASCNDIKGAAITTATNNGTVGFMLLNGKRLGNSGAIEAIPNAAIQYLQQVQANGLGAAIAGEIQWNAGTRGGVDGDKKLSCTSASLATCYIGRFGWLGDRVSLEDQVANAAFVEMNMTTKAGYKALYPNGSASPVRYNRPNCGPADQACVTSNGNSDLLESDVDRMADYARWLGIPTRSEFTVGLKDVTDGEAVFKQLSCNSCHVIGKIQITDPNDTMLTKPYRDRLATHTLAPTAYPFVSYLGTDLLMHDMGYLSQAGNATSLIRDQNTGVVFNGCPSVLTVPCNANTPGYVKSQDFRNYVQKVRTPPLKGLRFNRFVTESHLNTVAATPPNPACDFLLHDGRACDAIEAAFLHDGPMIKALGVIPKLTALTPQQLQQLRAFLYSL